ncbi:MAG: hypothetical protein BGO12_15865 [Verrucomicrobia bacterium 61-8]|nr:MAG: hypothetical protein BGO12_15865 [Verrucomicrobia bacterium 61-8]
MKTETQQLQELLPECESITMHSIKASTNSIESVYMTKRVINGIPTYDFIQVLESKATGQKHIKTKDGSILGQISVGQVAGSN